MKKKPKPAVNSFGPYDAHMEPGLRLDFFIYQLPSREAAKAIIRHVRAMVRALAPTKHRPR